MQGRGSKPRSQSAPDPLERRPSCRGVDRNSTGRCIARWLSSPLMQGRGSKHVDHDVLAALEKSPLMQGRGSKLSGRRAEAQSIASPLMQGRGSKPGPAPGLPEGIRRSEEHTSELQSLMRNSYAVFCLKKKKN